MRVSIYEDSPVKDKKIEFKLKLFRFPDRVVLALADETGKRIISSSLVAITDDMKISRCQGINTLLGIPLVENDSLEMKKGRD